MANFHVIAGAGDKVDMPMIRRIELTELFDALRLGAADFWEKPSHYALLALIYPIIGIVLTVWMNGFYTWPLLYPLIGGFADDAQELTTPSPLELAAPLTAALGADLARPVGADGHPVPAALLQRPDVDGHPAGVPVLVLGGLARRGVGRAVHREVDELHKPVRLEDGAEVVQSQGQPPVEDLEGRRLALLGGEHRVDPDPMDAPGQADR